MEFTMIARPDLQTCIDKMNKLFFATITGDENKHSPIADKLFSTIPPHENNMMGYAEQMCAVLDSVLLGMMMSPDYDHEFKMSWWNGVKNGQDQIRQCGRTYTFSLLTASLNEVQNEARSARAASDAAVETNLQYQAQVNKLIIENKQLIKQHEDFKAEVNAQLNKISGGSYRQKMF